MQIEGPPTTGPKVSFVSKSAILAPGNKAGCQTSADIIICSPKGDHIPIPHHMNRKKRQASCSPSKMQQSYIIHIYIYDYICIVHCTV